MILKSLKVRIAGTIFLLIFLAILIGNVVVVIFWQKGIIRSEVDHAQKIMGLVWGGSRAMEEPDSDLLREGVKDTCTFTGSGCDGVYYYDGVHPNASIGSGITNEMKNFARTTVLSRRPLVRVSGDAWGALFFGGKTVLIGQPVKSEGEYGAVVMALKLDPIYKTLREDRNIVLVYLLVNSLLLFVVGFFRMVKLFIKPIERMVDISEKYQLNEEVLFGGGSEQGELAKLALALNNMLRRIESDKKKLQGNIVSLENANQQLVDTQKEMIRTEKLASVGRLSAGLAHEIGNPVGIVQGYVELLSQPDITVEERRQFQERALSELNRVNKLIRQLLDFARKNSEESTVINLKALIDEIGQLASFKKSDKITFRNEIGEAIYIRGEADGIRQVFMNCILNAVDAIKVAKKVDKRGIIRVSAIEKDIIEQEVVKRFILAKIEDNGAGIEEEVLDTMFDPFVTTKELGKGTGLGLFVSHQIVEASGGKIWAESECGSGTTINILLPKNPIEN